MVEVGNTSEYIPCRVELLHPNTDWESVWRRSRLSGLGSEFSSFLYRILHDLLPTKERQQRISPSTTSVCSLCPSNSVESLEHAFFHCSFNSEFGIGLLQALSHYDSSLTPEKILHLDFNLEDDEFEHPFVWLIAANLLHIWNCRTSANRTRLYTIRAEVESKVALLRETRYRASAEKILEIINSEV